MKTKYRVKGLSILEHNRGNIIRRTITIETPDGLSSSKLDCYPADNNIDFRDYTYDFDLIIDWEVKVKKLKKKKEQQITVPQIFEHFNAKEVFNDEILLNLLVVYKRMYSNIKDLPIEKQIDITFSSLNIGLDAATEAYKRMKEILTDNLSEDTKNIIENYNKKTLKTSSN